MNPFMIAFFIISAVSSIPAWSSEAIEKVVQKSSLLPSQTLDGHRSWVSIGEDTDVLVSDLQGFHIESGYQFRFVGLDARFSTGTAQYRALSVSQSHSQSAEEADFVIEGDDSEILRPRNEKDRWLYWMVEPGISISGRLFVDSLPLLSERVRTGFSFGSYSDQAHHQNFTSWIFSTEAALIYRLSEKNPWSVLASVSWHWGSLTAEQRQNSSRTMRRIPVSWTGTSIGVLYSF